MEIKTVQHDGTRNYFGGRNLIVRSASPVYVTDIYETPCIVGQSRIDISMLVTSTCADYAQADYAFLNAIPPGLIGYGQLEESVLTE